MSDNSSTPNIGIQNIDKNSTIYMDFTKSDTGTEPINISDNNTNIRVERGIGIQNVNGGIVYMKF